MEFHGCFMQTMKYPRKITAIMKSIRFHCKTSDPSPSRTLTWRLETSVSWIVINPEKAQNHARWSWYMLRVAQCNCFVTCIAYSLNYNFKHLFWDLHLWNWTEPGPNPKFGPKGSVQVQVQSLYVQELDSQFFEKWITGVNRTSAAYRYRAQCRCLSNDTGHIDSLGP
jgi:hypothetical protein